MKDKITNKDIVENLMLMHERLVAVERVFDSTLSVLLSEGIVTQEQIQNQIFKDSGVEPTSRVGGDSAFTCPECSNRGGVTPSDGKLTCDKCGYSDSFDAFRGKGVV